MGWPEHKLQAEVIKLAQQLGWRHYHTHDSRRSVPGFPDLVMVCPGTGVLLFRELKREGEYPTPEQREWLSWLEGAGQDVGVWRPRDWLDGRVQERLRADASRR